MASAAINTVQVPPSPSFPDFEFRFSPSAASSMLPADQLFSGGFLLPLRNPPPPPPPPPPPSPPSSPPPPPEVPRSPKAPRCSSRWKELFGLKRAAQRAASHRSPNPTSSPRNPKPRSPKPSPDPLSVPLLRDLDPPKEKPSPPSLERERGRARAAGEKERRRGKACGEAYNNNNNNNNNVGGACERGRKGERGGGGGLRWASVDSPRVSSTGRVVFQNLGRSASSPGSFAGGGGGGGRRSFSGAGFVAAPVLNVGLGQLLFSPQKKDGGAGGGGGTNGRSGSRR